MTAVITSPTLVFIPESELIADYVLSFAVLAFVLFEFYRRYRKAGMQFVPAVRYILKNMRRFVAQIMNYGALHRKNIKNRYAGFMHLMIFYGTLILFICTSLIFLSHDILKTTVGYGILVGDFYLNFEVWANIGGVMLVLGLLMAMWRRLRKKVPLDTITQDFILISVFLLLAIEGFFLGALKIALDRQSFDVYRFVEWPLSYIYAPVGLTGNSGIEFYRGLWMFHVLTAFALAAYLPFSKLSHMFYSAVGIGVHPQKERGELSTPFMLSEAIESGNFDFKVGARNVVDLSYFQKTDAIACTDCGRCERACPAVSAGTDLDPRVVVQNIQRALWNGDAPMIGTVISENAAWSCTTCQACVEECPVLIDPQSYNIEARRTLVMDNKLSKETSTYLNNLGNTQNPFGGSNSDRDKMLEYAPKISAGVDTVYWVGCMGAFDPRYNKTARDVIEILTKGGVSFGLLGSEEKCNGETARRIGEEGRFQELVMQNIETFEKYGIKKIITSCPHCMNTFRNEYPKFGLKAEVVHHSQIIEELMRDEKIRVRKTEETVTLHDPCYLGRINGEFDNTRLILNSTSNLREMEKSREKSFCCGGGGGNYWYKVDTKESISKLRMKQALETKAQTVAVACPFCTAMLEDASRTMDAEKDIRIRDIAEIVKENME
ncbi:MAG: heterodisulfide reductase-related iron-sulfur binding cluster [Candidatus Thermoplasmatota archaeon]|jgi:Fe-S oxidoreductase/nitrate reductase gamma subunit|nr:heterodisulfide reductase-related iron-sulfur binding cluster [Candidatus Thermoplasmatota archaeon]MCL5791257.1 heterodisulfide reductase-related iron-sulfur binding cluster [Candidatus Thermoplasmatota archaeon]